MFSIKCEPNQCILWYENSFEVPFPSISLNPIQSISFTFLIKHMQNSFLTHIYRSNTDVDYTIHPALPAHLEKLP